MNDDIKTKILARRAKFIAAAIAGIAACGGSTEGPQVCLTTDSGEPSDTAPPAVCLSIRTDSGKPASDAASNVDSDVGPEVCLSPLLPDSGRGDDGTRDTQPQVCLSPPLPDTGHVEDGARDTQPQVCLSPPLIIDTGRGDADDGATDGPVDVGPKVCLSVLAADNGKSPSNRGVG